MKNIQPIISSSYEAFGFAVETGPEEVTYYFRKGITHTTGGGLFYITFSGFCSTAVSEPILIHSEIENISGVSGGVMDDGTTVIFYVVTHIGGTRDIYIVKGNMNNSFGDPVLFDWTNVTKLAGGFFFGPMITGDAPGEYYHIIYQVGTGRYRTSIVKTTDYWQSYVEIGVLYDGSIQCSETAGINLGGGKFLALSRNNISGSLIPFESTDYGATWIRRPSCNLYWWNGGGVEIPNIYGHDGVFDIFYECRDTSMMQISKGNTVAANFGNATPVYNEPEIYCYHRGTGGNPSLGYGSQIKLSNGKYFMIFSKEYTSTKANLQWTIDDLVSDVNGVINAPMLTISTVTATSFRFDITNYSDWQSIRYCLMDLSTTEDFSSFVTCKYRSISAYPAAKIENIRVIGYWDTFNGLTTGTTYWLRIKGCNNIGSSDYTIMKVKTL